MKNSLEKLLVLAKFHTEAHNDDKTICNLMDMLALLENGARLLKSNVEQVGGSYVTEAMYKGYRFITVHHEPIKTKTRLVNYSDN